MSRVVIHIAGRQRPRLEAEQLGDDTITGGGGGYEVRERGGRTPLTAWVATPGRTWTLPLTFDGYDATTETSVEQEIALLDSWSRPLDSTDEPPPLRVRARVGRAPATSRWVIDTIELGDQIRNTAGDRIRQDLTLTLLEYEPGNIKKGPAARSRAGKTHKWVPISKKDRRCKRCKRDRDDKRHSNR